MAQQDPARPDAKPARKLTRDINADTPQPADPAPRERLHRPASEGEYNHDKLDAGDLLDNVTSTFDNDIDLPRA